MLRDQLEVQRVRAQWALLGAEASADRFAEDGLGRIHQKRAADQRLDDLGDGATTADREFLDAP
jgi:hypothetical protein